MIIRVLSSFLFLACSVFAQLTVDLPDYIAAGDAAVEEVKVGLEYCEGPAVDNAGNVFFTEFTGEHIIWKVSTDGEAVEYRKPANNGNGLEFDIDGKLVSASTGMIEREVSPGQWEPVTPSVTDDPIGNANDLSIGPDGGIYFTNRPGGYVFFLDPQGGISSWGGWSNPNGVEWVPEKNIVYLCANTILIQYETAPDHSLINPVELTENGNFDGLTLDEQGNIYLASTNQSVRVYDSTGRSLGAIKIGGKASNCVFGGPEGKTLYITGRGGLWKVDLLIPGREKYPKETGVKFAPVLNLGQNSAGGMVRGSIVYSAGIPANKNQMLFYTLTGARAIIAESIIKEWGK